MRKDIVKDFEVMDGLFYMLPKDVKEDIWREEILQRNVVV